MKDDLFAEFERLSAEYATAQAQVDYLSEFRKSKKAQLMRAAEKRGVNSAAMQEREAYASDDYIQHLDAMHVANETALALKWKLEGMRIKFEYWRTRQATRRAEMTLK